MPPLLSKKSAPPLPQEKIYYLKLCKLLLEVARPVLQDVFDAIHLPTNLTCVLSTPKVQNELLQLQKKKVLYQYQIDILNLARKGSVTSAAFDISLLIVLLRNFCNITSSPTDLVWNSEPSTADKSKADDIVRIRLCRNDLYHRTNLALTEGDFEKKWVEIKEAVIRLGGGTKYEEDIQNIKVGSVDPEMEKHYHDLLRSREEAEVQQVEDINYIKTELKDVKKKLDESESSVTIDIKTKFKLFAAGAVTIGWAAGCTYFLNRYKDDPEIVTGLVQRAIIPCTLAMGATVVGILRGSIIIKIKVTSLAALDYLWKSCNDGGEMEQNLHKVIVTDELIQQTPHGTDSIGISVTMSEDDYRRARRDTFRSYCHSSIPSHRKRDKSKTNYGLSGKRMRRHDQTQSLLTDKRREADKGNHWNKSGNSCYQSEEFPREIEYHEKNLSTANKINSEIKESEHSYLGQGYDSQVWGYQRAMEFCVEHSLYIAKKIGERQNEGIKCCANLANICTSLGKYQMAIEFHEYSLCIAKEIGDKLQEGIEYANLGNAHALLGEYHRAIEWHERNLSIAKEIGNKLQEGIAYANLGNAYFSLKNYHKAIGYYESSLSIAKDIGNKLQEGIACANLGNAYFLLKNYHKAIAYYERSLSIAKEIGDRLQEDILYANLDDAHRSLREHRIFNRKDEGSDSRNFPLEILRKSHTKRPTGNDDHSLRIYYKAKECLVAGRRSASKRDTDVILRITTEEMLLMLETFAAKCKKLLDTTHKKSNYNNILHGAEHLKKTVRWEQLDHCGIE